MEVEEAAVLVLAREVESPKSVVSMVIKLWTRSEMFLHAATHLWIAGPHMNSSYLWRSVWSTPNWLWEFVRLLLFIFFEQIFDRTRYFLHLLWRLEQVHLVVLVPDFIRQATRPCLDLIKLMLLFVISCFTDIDFLICWEISRSSFVVPREEHNEASIHNLIYGMVTILASLDDLIFKKMTVISVHRLLGSVVPTSINPFGAILILPCAVDLSNNWFSEVVGVLDMYPVASNIVSDNQQPEFDHTYQLSTTRHCAEFHPA